MSGRTDGSTGAGGPGRAPRGARGEPACPRGTWAEVDLDAIADNVAALRAHARASGCIAVVKADGYGHGLLPTARAALRGGADRLAVALVEEGLALRAAGISAPVLVMAEPRREAVAAMLSADLTPAVYSGSFLDALAAASRERGGPPVAVHLKLDTGMRRVGVVETEWEAALTRIREAPELALEGLWSHLAVADEPDHPFNALQAAAFERGLDLARRLGVPPEVAHLANSAAVLALPDTHYDLIRPGLAIYGLQPRRGFTDVALRPAMAWYSRLALVKAVAEGEGVSYGLTWTAPAATTLGTVAAGYADGVVRGLSNRGEVLVGGRRVPIVGRVCMDQFCVDLGAAEAAIDDEVCLIGRQGPAAVSADDWADWLDTINYEIVCGVGPRVPRHHVGGG